jgi:hypothetical protein
MPESPSVALAVEALAGGKSNPAVPAVGRPPPECHARANMGVERLLRVIGACRTVPHSVVLNSIIGPPCREMPPKGRWCHGQLGYEMGYVAAALGNAAQTDNHSMPLDVSPAGRRRSTAEPDLPGTRRDSSLPDGAHSE